VAELLRTRSIRTLAWLGDAAFEDVVRRRIAARGDWPVDRLDAIKAAVVCAAGQAELLAEIEPLLDDAERALASRARNAGPTGTGPRRGPTAEYRAATALEALVAAWLLEGSRSRFDALLAGPLDRAIEAAVARHAKRPRRG
jgi:ribonuclease-3 family protein